jgi:ribosomal-protein-alanine N-acetyltransferase
MDHVKVRRAGDEDLQRILAVERSAGDSPHWAESVWAKVLSADETAHAVFVAEIGEWLVGFVVLGFGAGMAEIESIAVVDDLRRQGIGGCLCLEGIRWARDVGATQVGLEVRASNRTARALYGSLGFLEQGVRRGYYKAPVEDAILMGLPCGSGTA